MAKQDEISSTEKLLELIRADGPQNNPAAADPEPSKTKPRGSSFLSGSFSLRRKISIGVDVGPNDLRLIKVNHISENKHEVVACERVAFDPALPKDGPEFHKFLESSLGRFIGREKAPEIWCTISAARVDLRLMRIPKVAPKQVATSVFWSFQRESPFAEKEKIFDFELLGDVDERGITKTEVMAYSVPLREVKKLEEQFAGAGFPLTGISIIPFAYQTLLRSGLIESTEGDVASLYIGRDWSRIDIFCNRTLRLSRGIKAGAKTMLEAIRKQIEAGRLELTPAPVSSAESRVDSEGVGLEADIDQAQQILFGGRQESSQLPVSPDGAVVPEENIFQMILPALERLVKQVERTIKHYASTHENALVGKILISSAVRPNHRIVEFISRELGLPTETMNPFAENSHLVAKVPCRNPRKYKAPMPRLWVWPCRAMDHTELPVHLQGQTTGVRGQRVNRAIFSFFWWPGGCVGISYWQTAPGGKNTQRAQLQNQMESYHCGSTKIDHEAGGRIPDSNQSVQSLARDIWLCGDQRNHEIDAIQRAASEYRCALRWPGEKPKKDDKKVQPRKTWYWMGLSRRPFDSGFVSRRLYHVAQEFTVVRSADNQQKIVRAFPGPRSTAVFGSIGTRKMNKKRPQRGYPKYVSGYHLCVGILAFVFMIILPYNGAQELDQDIDL